MSDRCVRAVIVGLSLTVAVASWAEAQNAPSQPAVQNPPGPTPVFKATGVAPTPLPGIDLPVEDVAAPVQSATSDDIERSSALGVSDYLALRINGVHLNEMQGNPFQPDVNYRGYTASPLLGTPQGLSVYMDGVRMNQPFGDAVSWDLIPRLAMASVTLMPGSNPLFGLNTLGGALSIQTKDGKSHPGTSVQASYGSDVRRAIEFEHGGAKKDGTLNWYLTGNVFGEDGWRDDSPSDVRHIFGKLGWQRGKTDMTFTSAYANNSLTGNGLQEQGFLSRDYKSVYTKPDTTDNESTFVNVTARHATSATLTWSGNVYYRHIRTNTLNGDINEDSLDQSLYQPGNAERAALAAAGYTGVPASGATAANTPFPSWRCIGNALIRDEPGEKCNGLINRGNLLQDNGGLSAQATALATQGRVHHQLVAGGAYDHSSVGFGQSSELGFLNPDRSVTGVGAFGDGVTGGNVDGEPFDTRVDLHGKINTWSAYATDTIGVGDAWHLTLSGRYNRTLVSNRDAVTPGGGEGSLDTDQTFQRFNPAVGFTFNPSKSVNAYVGYSEGSRAATSIELGCADPNEPCKLPNAMAGDPPLTQVVTRTWESGLRSGPHSPIGWSVNVFRADNRDDILFVASGQTGFGYFKNFGSTRRQGFDMAVDRRFDRVSIGANYTFLSATYQSDETVDGTGNSRNEAALSGGKGLEGTIDIAPGDHMPLIPRHMFKAFAGIEVTRKLSADLDLVAISSWYARGNENNEHQPDGVYYLGPGIADGYAVVNLGARYQVTPKFQLFVKIDNVADRHYSTAAQLGPTGFTNTGNFIARALPAIGGEFPVQQTTFFAPGAPRTFLVGTRVQF